MNVRKLVRNPWAVIGLAALGGWLVGSGVFTLPLGLPSIGGGAPAPHPTNPAEPAAPGTLPASSSSAATLPATSAAMPSPTLAPDPFAGFDI